MFPDLGPLTEQFLVNLAFWIYRPSEVILHFVGVQIFIMANPLGSVVLSLPIYKVISQGVQGSVVPSFHIYKVIS